MESIVQRNKSFSVAYTISKAVYLNSLSISTVAVVTLWRHL